MKSSIVSSKFTEFKVFIKLDSDVGIVKRSLFDFQFLDADNLEENSIMDVDLEDLRSSKSSKISV